MEWKKGASKGIKLYKRPRSGTYIRSLVPQFLSLLIATPILPLSGNANRFRLRVQGIGAATSLVLANHLCRNAFPFPYYGASETCMLLRLLFVCDVKML